MADKLNLSTSLYRLYNRRVYPYIEEIRGATWTAELLRKFAVRKMPSVYRYSIPNGEMEDKYLSEPKFVEEFLKRAEGKTVYDIGGYRGFFSIIAAKAGADKVYCFEMDSSSAKDICENINAVGEQDKIEVIERPCWSEAREITFEQGKKQLNKVGSGDITKEAVKLDGFISDHTLPDILKIDVEGAEHEVLEGAEKILDKKGPEIFLEIHSSGKLQEFGSSSEEIFEYLESKNYRWKVLQKDPETWIIAWKEGNND